jgi:acyl-coenzyme A thioesterase PaaI-like protein
MSPVVTNSDLEQLLSKAAFARSYGFGVRSCGDGECTIGAPFQPSFERPGRIIAGPVFMAAADIAMWLAIITKLGIHANVVTAEMKTNFLNGATEEDFLCRAKILKLGNRLIYGVAECVNGTGKLLTHHTITYIRVERRGPALDGSAKHRGSGL